MLSAVAASLCRGVCLNYGLSGRIASFPSSSLGTAIVGEAPASNARPIATGRLCPNLTKQSFGDKCVPKLELGNEAARWTKLQLGSDPRASDALNYGFSGRISPVTSETTG